MLQAQSIPDDKVREKGTMENIQVLGVLRVRAGDLSIDYFQSI
uniref:Uncharacterized protein n=1 Tax=Nelumbo nucifera TaxID=4432 RepID=A0A822XEZ4_NELNU|nr:TPA_asm: hypothetical protein HUJ06_019676 [Nelumbo nucifera]